MKKLTKQDLDDLAKVMPKLSEVVQYDFQYDFIGGCVVVVNKRGECVGSDALNLRSNVLDAGYGYDQVVNDASRTLWPVEEYSGRFSSCYVDEETIKRNMESATAENNFDFEGTGIYRDVLQFLGEHTDVEWMMYETMSGDYGRMQSDV